MHHIRLDVKEGGGRPKLKALPLILICGNSNIQYIHFSLSLSFSHTHTSSRAPHITRRSHDSDLEAEGKRVH